MQKNLIILRGVPGSGKTLLANLFETKAICCADDWHIKNGKYGWKHENATNAHRWCKRKCERFMVMGAKKIIVSNTNTTKKELEPYLNLGKKYNYIVHTIVVENRHGSKNTHSVPDETLNQMKERFEIVL